ncbi:MAG: tRNA methyl transferase PRC-barrel domain-containing protein [Sellimonas intestinalis]
MSRKDQTYALYNLTQEQLSHTLMPIGTYEKDEIRRIAQKAGISVAQKADSQDICFIPDGDYASFIRNYTGNVPAEGNFVDRQGKILGRHKGMIHYTVGQRKGLGIALGYPAFVLEIRPKTNEIVLGNDEESLTTTVRAHLLNAMGVEHLMGMEGSRTVCQNSL